MITITKKEDIVFNQVKIFINDYPDGIPLSVLRKETGFYEHDLNDILKMLDSKDIVKYQKGHVWKGSNFDVDFNTVESQKEVISAELDMKEKKSYEIIKNAVNENNMISKYDLEGHLLYGELKLSDFRMYHIILSLENKGLLKYVRKMDGEYYKLIEK
ncbi:MAG: hypothetical protein MJ224_01840 [archaeon]|nr:hypothetical protein [archaeon]